jgi:hypothetical protein
VSATLGRPPALYDLDCTVQYIDSTSNVSGPPDLLDDVARILLVLETIILEVYGTRRKISLQLTRHISHRLKEWADRSMARLNALIKTSTEARETVGACHALGVYYYSVMSLSKPFLMFEAHQNLSNKQTALPRNAATAGRRALAEGCVDAACCFVEMVVQLTRSRTMPQRMPLIV